MEQGVELERGENNMAKYEVGRKLIEIDELEYGGAILTIVAVAPEKDYDGEQAYFVEVVGRVDEDNYNSKTIKYYSTYDEDFLDRWTRDYKG